MKKLLSFALAGMLLSACGGGGGTTALPSGGSSAAATPATSARSSVTFTLKLPARKPPSATIRRPLYISASMLSLAVTLTAQNGTPVTSPQPYAVNISSCPTVSGIVTCSLSVPASVGADTFTVATYDAAQSSSAPTTLAGNVLSSASAATTVIVNTANTLTLTLNGVVHSIALALASAAPLTGATATIPLTVTARDADNNVIIGPGNYTAPITLTNSDTSGATTLSTTSVTGPATVVTVAYTGAPTTASFGASAPGGITATASSLVSRTSRIYISDDSHENVQSFTNAGSPTTPTFVTGSAAPQGIAVDRSGNVYVTDNLTNTVKKYASTGGSALLTISGLGNPLGVAVDAAGNIYVADAGVPAVKKYNATGTLQMTITTGLIYDTSVAVDQSGNIYVADLQASDVEEYGPTGGSPIRTISNGTGQAFGVAVDAAGKVYVTTEGTYRVQIYPATGANPAPIRTILVSNGAFNLLNPGTNTVNDLFQLAVDQAGLIYVVAQSVASNGVTSLVLIYPSGSASPSSTAPSQATLQGSSSSNYASWAPAGVAVY